MQLAILVTGDCCYRCIGISPRRSRISRRFMGLSRRFRRLAAPCAVIALASGFFLMVLAEHTDAHTPVTSKYDYNKDVFPLLKDHCAGCHVKGGPAPMSLMT